MSKTFAKNVAYVRRSLGMSQRDASAGLGISQALLSHYETGSREPGLDFFARICDYYNVSADYLLGRTADANSSERYAGNLRSLAESLRSLAEQAERMAEGEEA